MSADEDHVSPVPVPAPAGGAARAPKLSPEDSDALLWLGKWIGIPLLILIVLYYSEFLFERRPADFVPSVTHQEVRPYPFPPGASGPSFAPPEVPRIAPPPPPLVPPVTAPPPQTPINTVPRLISQPQPLYPQRALEAEREGVVRLRVTIAPDGSVADATVIDARPSGWFEAAAIGAVRRWHYEAPGRVVVTEAEIEFKLR